MQVSLRRITNHVRAEKNASTRIYELFIVLCLLIIPIVAFTSKGSLLGSSEFQGIFGPSELMPVVLVALAVMTMILCIRLFRDMHSSTQADVILSLPMSAKERFFSKVLTFARLILLPYLCSAVISSAAAIIADKTAYEHSDVPIGYYIKGLSVFFMSGLCVIMYTAAVCFLCSSFCSSIATAAGSSVLTAGAVAIICTRFLDSYLPLCAGVSFHNGYTEHFLFGLEPIKYLPTSGNDDTIWRLDFYRWLAGTAGNILISLIVMLLSIHIYKRRDKSTLTHNQLSKPFMLLVISLTGMAAIIYGVFASFSYMPYAALIAGLMLYALLLWRSGFKLKKCIGWLLGFAGVMAGFAAFLALTFFTDGLGLAKHPCYYRDEGNYEAVISREYTETSEKGIEYYQYDEMHKASISREDIDDITEICEKYTSDIKGPESFCELVGLSSKKYSKYFDYEYMENAVDDSGDNAFEFYSFEPEKYNRLRISFMPDYFTENAKENPDNISEPISQTQELYYYAEMISISGFITEENYQKLKAELSSKYGVDIVDKAIDFNDHGFEYDYIGEEGEQ